jgi:hypothetical protein
MQLSQCAIEGSNLTTCTIHIALIYHLKNFTVNIISHSAPKDEVRAACFVTSPQRKKA